ncbi:MAG: DNA starvation/stationary phase protection protein, partial [Alphaproteobacteria bacterium]|nr:DNA starvation/stationary phase protection protein [Alphaproteobacteria bacterium]
HNLFEVQYNELWAATDVIAERIRALDVVAPRSYGEMQEAASIKSGGDAKDANDMLKDLVKGHETVVATIRKALELADANGDEATADILTPRLTEHEKTAWMLRSTIG